MNPIDTAELTGLITGYYRETLGDDTLDATSDFFASTALALSVAGSTCRPEPGWTTLAATSPTTSASVLAT
ncbi:hypothetical protein ABZ646_44075, partial [Streptomyces sp. NPDC007162]|uniref:hypothetical protein n=1 Tax=Streptomyces sp. NPDC007162 TaxID=3156917 RepID=UPI00340D9B84